MSAAEILDALVASSDPAQTIRRLDALSGEERNDLRSEMIRRLAAGELSAATALAVLPSLGVEPAVPELVPLLRSAAPVSVRAAALLLLRRHTTYDVELESETLDRDSLPELVEEAIGMHHAAELAAQKGTPFERLSLADPEDEDNDIDELIDELLESFWASPEASSVKDQEELRFWTGELLRLGVGYGHGSPAVWGPDNIDEIVAELLPRKVALANADEARAAVPAFRAFFRWASRVAPLPDAEAIDAVLEEYEPDFPEMMMDERRFGLAKSFVARGAAAGFDMSAEEGLLAFAEHQNRERAAAAARSRRKLDAAKKRKAKMARMSRKKNRRK
jgi:hypothetical protein